MVFRLFLGHIIRFDHSCLRRFFTVLAFLLLLAHPVSCSRHPWRIPSGFFGQSAAFVSGSRHSRHIFRTIYPLADCPSIAHPCYFFCYGSFLPESPAKQFPPFCDLRVFICSFRSYFCSFDVMSLSSSRHFAAHNLLARSSIKLLPACRFALVFRHFHWILDFLGPMYSER